MLLNCPPGFWTVQRLLSQDGQVKVDAEVGGVEGLPAVGDGLVQPPPYLMRPRVNRSAQLHYILVQSVTF